MSYMSAGEPARGLRRAPTCADTCATAVTRTPRPGPLHLRRDRQPPRDCSGPWPAAPPGLRRVPAPLRIDPPLPLWPTPAHVHEPLGRIYGPGLRVSN
ncbi:hypothetical protein EVAR_18671_1 [Eumeta japonica]|uniref:Uncharacterized protein n=1 Tax=Eumeta variegata TaxID=151549 RepID=A0A4C1U6Z5_EUMVA|nr:hypothetical protein EVAR_18671_1 [Eumeta japonica]